MKLGDVVLYCHDLTSEQYVATVTNVRDTQHGILDLVVTVPPRTGMFDRFAGTPIQHAQLQHLTSIYRDDADPGTPHNLNAFPPTPYTWRHP